MMKCYRIYTESTGAMRTRAIVEVENMFPDGFTVIDCEGNYEGEREASIIIEIIADVDVPAHGGRVLSSFSLPSRKVRAVARSIKRLNNQDAVLVTTTDIEGEFI